WFLTQLDPEGFAYNVPGASRLRGRLQIEALSFAFREIVRRHESLRATFPARDGRPVQLIRSLDEQIGEPRIKLVDLSAQPAVQREQDALRFVQEEARRPFDLTYGPLLRTTLIRLGEADHILIVVTHHIVTDGWSSRIFR